MATKEKDSTVGKEKKAPSSSSPITSTKKTTKPSTTTSSTKDKATSNPSGKQTPNYLKPTISSRLESQSFKLPRNDAPNKATINRRRSFDKPTSPSRLLKQNQPSLSRQNKALVSPGPRDRSLPFRSKSVAVKSNSPSKPISERISKTPREGKTQPPIAKKSSPSVATPTTKKVAATDASVNSTKSTTDASANSTKSTTAAETTEAINVETEPEVKEAINEEIGEIENVENPKHAVENVSEIPPHVDSEPNHDNEHDRELDESYQPHIQTDDEKVIPTENSEKEVQIKDEHEEGENTNQDECNINESQPEINHSTNEEVEVKEKEEEGGLTNTIAEDNKNETNNEEEAVEGGISVRVELKEGQDEQEQVESEEKEAMAESPEAKQEAAGGAQGKRESPVSNEVIEETATKLSDRKNKVRALAGAFQSVIDFQSK